MGCRSFSRLLCLEDEEHEHVVEMHDGWKDREIWFFAKENHLTIVTKGGTNWMPVIDSDYYTIVRYYGPTPRLKGNTAMDIVYRGTELEDKIKAVKFE